MSPAWQVLLNSYRWTRNNRARKLRSMNSVPCCCCFRSHSQGRCMQHARHSRCGCCEFRSAPPAIKPALDESTSSYHPQTSRVLVLRCNKSREAKSPRSCYTGLAKSNWRTECVLLMLRSDDFSMRRSHRHGRCKSLYGVPTVMSLRIRRALSLRGDSLCRSQNRPRAFAL